uniref:Uncharacterized protein n=1 Tax=Anguilla anguilla TaxID=7936 RepID=A0A0E9TQ88_ANGAN
MPNYSFCHVCLLDLKLPHPFPKAKTH